jgi:hypothetical protein
MITLTRLYFGNSLKARKDHSVYDDTKAAANFNCFEFDEFGDRENAGGIYRIAKITPLHLPL